MKKTLEEICLSKGEYGGGFSAVDYFDDAPRYVRITDITADGTLNENKKAPSGEQSEWSKYFLQEGDILFARSGATVGKTFIYEKSYGECVYAGYLIRFKPNTEIAFPKYIYYFTRTQAYKAWIQNKQNVVAQPNINAKQYGKELKIPLPPLAEQKKIAAILDEADKVRQLNRALLAEYDALSQSLFLEMFGDPVTNPKGWEKQKFEYFVEFDTRMTTDFEKYANQPHIGIANIEKNTGKLVNYKSVSEDNLTSGKYIFTPEHIIYSKIRPNLNKVALPDFEGLCSADSYPLKVKSKNAHRVFFAYLLRSESFIDFILRHSTRTNIPKANKAQMKLYKGIAPPLPLQTEFAQRIATIEAQKAQAAAALSESEDLFAALLQNLFRA